MICCLLLGVKRLTEFFAKGSTLLLVFWIPRRLLRRK